MSWRRPLEENPLALSFLDLLSCGLGAAALLFLVFSTVNRGVLGQRGEDSATNRSSGWQSGGDIAPLEVIVRLPSPIDSGDFCWSAVEQLNLIEEGTTCDSTPTDPRPRMEFSVILPDGLPRAAFGARLRRGAAAISDQGILVFARVGGEQRVHRPQLATAGAERVFSINPRLWPTTVKP